MKLSTQEEYGLRCLAQIARHGWGASLTIAQISQLEGISVPNVAKVMRLLRRGGFVRSTRGQAGGYSLARPIEETVVGDVLAGLAMARFCPCSGGCRTPWTPSWEGSRWGSFCAEKAERPRPGRTPSNWR
jgi:Rrf2 family protein